MGELKASCGSFSAGSSPAPSTPPLLQRHHSINLLQPSQMTKKKKKKKKIKLLRAFRSVCRSFPILIPVCQTPVPGGFFPDTHRSFSNPRVTGTLFGHRKGRVCFSFQETSRCFPSLVVELAMQTMDLQKALSTGMVRIALESEKRAGKENIGIMDEPLWTMYCNGKKTGYGVKREAMEEDLNMMELLRAVSMGAGVLPGESGAEGPDGEIAYMRAYFERVVGSKDSETFYMLSPDVNSGPELSIFFVRV